MTFKDALEVVERPTKLEPDRTYRLLTAKRNRGGITLRGELFGKEILTKTQFEAKGGDFLISRRQIIHGACGIVPDALDGAIVSNEYSTLHPRSILLLDFLQHYTHAPYFQRTCFHSSHGVDVEKMIFKIDEWLVRPFDVPPVAEQRKIAAILSSVDDAIESTQAVIDQLGVVKKAMMAQLLLRGLPRRHARFKQTEIGEVPDTWSLAQLSEIAALQMGETLIAKDLSGDGIPVFSAGRDPAPWGYTSRSKKSFSRGTIILGARGTIGYPRLPAQEKFVSTQTTIAVTPSARVIPIFLKYALDCQNFENITATQAIPMLTIAALRDMRLSLPPVREQQEIADILLSVDEAIESTQAVVKQRKTVKSALLSVLLTGEVRVTPDPEAP